MKWSLKTNWKNRHKYSSLVLIIFFSLFCVFCWFNMHFSAKKYNLFWCNLFLCVAKNVQIIEKVHELQEHLSYMKFMSIVYCNRMEVITLKNEKKNWQRAFFVCDPVNQWENETNVSCFRMLIHLLISNRQTCMNEKQLNIFNCKH